MEQFVDKNRSVQKLFNFLSVAWITQSYETHCHYVGLR
jgi:hypothetical protein